VEPFELGHFQKPMLSDLTMRPGIRGEDVHTHRIDQPRGTDRHVDEQKYKKNDPEPNTAEKVEKETDWPTPSRGGLTGLWSSG
jgi:hypothetical protein